MTPDSGDVDPSWLPPDPAQRLDIGFPNPRSSDSWFHRHRQLLAVFLVGIAGVIAGVVIATSLTGGKDSPESEPPAAERTNLPSTVGQPTDSPGQPRESKPSTPAVQPTALQPAAGSDLIVRTQSGRARCAVGSAEIVCQSSGSFEEGNRGFPQAPLGDAGFHWSIAVVDTNGNFHWGNGNIPGAYPENDKVMAYGQTYSAAGWNIESTEQGTTFTNQRTGRGMFVSIENVYAF